LPHLITKLTRGKKPLIDYFQSHVMITIEYLNILKGKTLNKPIVEKIGEGKRKRKKEKKIFFFGDYSK
jgi:hypothetical protein